MASLIEYVVPFSGIRSFVSDPEERPDGLVEDEHVDAVTGGETHDGAGAVEDVPRGDLPRSGLADGLLTIGLARIVEGDGEDGSHADTGIEIARTVERVEEHAVLPTLSRAPENPRLLVLLAGQHRDRRPIAETSHDDLVGDHVHLQLLLALDVLRAVGTEHVVEPRPADLVRDGLPGQRDRREDPGEIPLRPRVLRLLGQHVGLQARQIVVDKIVIRTVHAFIIDRNRNPLQSHPRTVRPDVFHSGLGAAGLAC